jgi:diguanylate cyclase (GGDEF)-like protein
MSFRSRLLLFFTIIVIVPMIAVALVLFSITADSETGQADSRIATGLRVAFSVYRESRAASSDVLTEVSSDRKLRAALGAGDADRVQRRLDELAASRRAPTSFALFDGSGRRLAVAGPVNAIAWAAAAPTTRDGTRLGTLAVSVTTADAYARRVRDLTRFDVRVFRDGRPVGSTLSESGDASPKSGEVTVAGTDYRGRFSALDEPLGQPVQVGVFEHADALSTSIDESRLVIAGILIAFLGLALASSIFVVRALQGQIEQFLEAARRLAKGDFSKPVPTHGHDEFAELGLEFNKMSGELAAKIGEVQSKRRELEETIRRVGDAFATGLDREGLVDLAVKTAVGACSADAGRAVPIDPRKMHRVHHGRMDRRLLAALEAAERKAFNIRQEDVDELLSGLESTDHEPLQMRRPTRANAEGAYALAAPLRARLGAGSDVHYVGVVSIARTGEEFTDAECDLFAYLAGQSAVSIENANLHETVQHQAVTDELTGLFNVRHFHETLDSEIERSRRYASEVGLAMLDIDNFKSINDTYGHQQGDLVLIEVARALRELSRDIDEPARYGGEEMAVILPQTDVAGAELLAERMRAAIAGLAIKRLDGGGAMHVTASFGVASLPQTATDKTSLIAAADAALYRAKRAGKNRVERAEPAAAPS